MKRWNIKVFSVMLVLLSMLAFAAPSRALAGYERRVYRDTRVTRVYRDYDRGWHRWRDYDRGWHRWHHRPYVNRYYNSYIVAPPYYAPGAFGYYEPYGYAYPYFTPGLTFPFSF